MDKKELQRRIFELEKEIARLPGGSIARKRINGHDYYYHRVSINGKRKETYINIERLAGLRAEIEQRKRLQKELRGLVDAFEPAKKKAIKEQLSYKTIVRTGELLRSQIEAVRGYKKRECIKELRDYIFGNTSDKVFILYGLRRTGKTTMIRQILGELSDEEFERAAFIQVTSKDTLADIDSDLNLLEIAGYTYVFIDEVTLMEDFVEGAAVFSDIYASSGMKIVLSGTDSLGFAFSKGEQLFDRCIMLHTTFISYREFEEVLGITGIDEYIRYGGTMSLGGVNYNEDATFSNVKNAHEYVDSAIAGNIQHSLSLYQYGGHFRGLLDLHERGELTNVINRVVENINHRFTKSVVERTFSSHDLSVTAANLLRDRERPINIKEHLDIDRITLGMMKVLDILNIEEQSIKVEEAHMVQIKEYLTLLDFVMDIDIAYLPETGAKGSVTAVIQPGLRYAQATAIVENILKDAGFSELSIKERKRILDRLLSEISGRLMEEIVLIETKIANPDKEVFKLQFAVGEFDMVVFDPEKLSCKIYEIKYSKEQVKDQYRHLLDPEKSRLTEHRYGDITGRYVIYRGEKAVIDEVQYLNVEEYLKGLNCS